VIYISDIRSLPSPDMSVAIQESQVNYSRT
jgi:hypothetical protein